MRSKPIYVVVMAAVYLHEIFGPFTRAQANKFAKAQADHPQEDGHHDYLVYRLTPKGLSEPLASYKGPYRPGSSIKGDARMRVLT
jgi:hypothetical protein